MDPSWERNFGRRFAELDADVPRPSEALPVSIKVRVDSGCFHREHSPRAYAIIDDALSRTDLRAERARFVEHESGPELLAWITLGAATLNLTTGLINLVVTVLRARRDGIRSGDHPAAALVLIVRGHDPKDEYREQRLLEIAPDDPIDADEIGNRIDAAITELYGHRDK